MTGADPSVTAELLTLIMKFDFDGYVDRLEELTPPQIGFSMQQAAVAAGRLAERLLGRPVAADDEEYLARVVEERHARMLPPELAAVTRLLVREITNPGTGLSSEIAGAALLYPVVLAAIGGAYDERREETA